MGDGNLNGLESGVYTVIIVIGLLGFGRWYDIKVEQWDEDAEGFTWVLVVVGTAVTLVGIGLLDLALDWNAGLIGLLGFSASGFFMSLGAIKRYVTMRKRMKRLAQYDAEKKMAERG